MWKHISQIHIRHINYVIYISISRLSPASRLINRISHFFFLSTINNVSDSTSIILTFRYNALPLTKINNCYLSKKRYIKMPSDIRSRWSISRCCAKKSMLSTIKYHRSITFRHSSTLYINHPCCYVAEMKRNS